MSTYDNHYKTESLFGKPHGVLLAFCESREVFGEVLALAVDRVEEISLVKRVMKGMKVGAELVVCIQDSGLKWKIPDEELRKQVQFRRLCCKRFTYTYKDLLRDHSSVSDYKMVVLKKID